MHWPIRRVTVSVVIIIATFFSEIYASETPETILIRQTLRLDLSGKRRSDSDIALSAYHKSFVAYNAENNNDPRRWNVIIEGRQALENNLKKFAHKIQYHQLKINPEEIKLNITDLKTGSTPNLEVRSSAVPLT